MLRRVPNQQAGEVEAIIAFLETQRYSKALYWASYEYWSKGEALGGAYWARTSGLGGTYTMMALMWYQHLCRPGTTVYRPSVVLEALCNAALGTIHGDTAHEGGSLATASGGGAAGPRRRDDVRVR